MPAKYPLKPGVTLIISGEGEKSGLDGLSEIQRFAVIERMTERAGANLSDYIRLRPERAAFYFAQSGKDRRAKEKDRE